MDVIISKPDCKLEASINLPASKSISNRLLMLRAMSGLDFCIDNLSEAEDTVLLQNLLTQIKTQQAKGTTRQLIFLDCGNAGTVFRFLLPYLASLPGTWMLSGSDRMKQRPVGPLVSALLKLGASITYLDKPGFPPLQIQGTILQGGEVVVDASESSQFASALMLLGGFLPGGLKINLNGDLVSQPYLRMTARLMDHFNLQTSFKDRIILIPDQQFIPVKVTVEPDWSSASYWFEAVCLSSDAEVLLKGLKFSGLQGDEAVAGLFYRLGVACDETDEGILLRKKNCETTHFTFDFRHNPDLAMTLAVAVAGLGITAELTGLINLAIKESHRLHALQTELQKMGCKIHGDEDSLTIEPSGPLHPKAGIQTFSDHRIALAFAPLATVTDTLLIHEAEVVKKSYPAYWEDLQSAGYKVEFCG